MYTMPWFWAVRWESQWELPLWSYHWNTPPLNYLVLMAPFEVTILGPTSSGRLRRALCSARCESQRQGYANTITALRCGVPEGSVMAIAGPFLHRSFLLWVRLIMLVGVSVSRPSTFYLGFLIVIPSSSTLQCAAARCEARLFVGISWLDNY